jgi:hypothetical protein
MNKWLKIIIGTIIFAGVLALVLPSMPLASWGIAALDLIKGGITLLVLLIGIILIVLGISELTD